MAEFADSLPGEIWKPVVGHEESHFVSNMGRVRTVPHWVNSKNGSTALKQGRILKPHIGGGGYPAVNVKRATTNVHRLVCEAFHGPAPFEGAQVAHGDGIRANNRAGNLRWTDAKGNAQDRNGHGTAPIGETAPNVKLTEAQVLEIRAAYSPGKGQVIADAYGITRTQVGYIVKRRQWTHI